MNNIKTKILVTIVVIILATATFWFFLYRDKDQRQISVPISEKSADMRETYTNPKYGFSFGYPKELSVSEFTEGDKDIVLVNKAAQGVFQVLISPFDEPEPLTKKRILKDIPDMAIADDKIISLGRFDKLTASGASALSFKSKNESKETLEIWFVHSGYLYQISSLPDFSDKLDKILETMLFR